VANESETTAHNLADAEHSAKEEAEEGNAEEGHATDNHEALVTSEREPNDATDSQSVAEADQAEFHNADEAQ